ncbi:hypothetical protein L6452_31178 [Arctium lappa]|uniref:Uncharacterized protein n=1 Tax=Arctium lappa TaxID=4217 RepID=A0ACB8ZL51_ARCLA|nr:hypothetical protein L6452_31178 [Arctium lappa]
MSHCHLPQDVPINDYKILVATIVPKHFSAESSLRFILKFQIIFFSFYLFFSLVLSLNNIIFKPLEDE